MSGDNWDEWSSEPFEDAPTEPYPPDDFFDPPEPPEPEPVDYYEGRLVGRIYGSKIFPLKFAEDEETGRFIQYVDDGFDEARVELATAEQTVIYESPKGKSQIKALRVEQDRRVVKLQFERFRITKQGEKPDHSCLTFQGETLERLLTFLQALPYIEFDSENRQRVSAKALQQILADQEVHRRLLLDKPDVVRAFLNSDLVGEDLVSLAYRKAELGVFSDLLSGDDGAFDHYRDLWGVKQSGHESVWQRYFERNPWVFGYGLNYIYLDGLVEERLEQVVQGFNIQLCGKRADAVMMTRGMVSSVVYAEIKTERTPLMAKNRVRPEVWAVSTELAGAVAQTQVTVNAAMRTLTDKIELRDKDGWRTQEVVHQVQPKAVLVIGSLGEFIRENDMNQPKHRCFELYRRHTQLPEIITFDELYARAIHIVGNIEAAQQ